MQTSLWCIRFSPWLRNPEYFSACGLTSLVTSSFVMHVCLYMHELSNFNLSKDFGKTELNFVGVFWLVFGGLVFFFFWWGIFCLFLVFVFGGFLFGFVGFVLLWVFLFCWGFLWFWLVLVF